MTRLDEIINGDCLAGLKSLPDGCVDLCVTDPPYELQQHSGAGAFGRKNREYHHGIDHLQSGVSNDILREIMRVCKRPNIYIFCSKDQLPQLLLFALDNGLKYDLLTWHKTNPVPTCNNKYLSDTEYIVFMRNGANLYGTYETKRKYFITPTNVEDKRQWGHPTIKPLGIVQTLISNSSQPGGGNSRPLHGERYNRSRRAARRTSLYRVGNRRRVLPRGKGADRNCCDTAAYRTINDTKR